MRAHYNISDIRNALNCIPIHKGDTLFIHSNLGFFGFLDGVNNSDGLCQAFFDELMRVLGENGTIIVPTFTYSFPRKEIFDPFDPVREMGIFSEWIRRHPDSHRSLDPSYSVAGIGKFSEELTWNAPENSFDENSFFGRFHEADGVVLNLNFDAGSTLLHFIERQMNVPYRFDKTFEGYIRHDGNDIFAKNTIYVRYLSSDVTAPAFESFTTLAREKGLFTMQNLGRGELGCIRAIDCKKLLEDNLPDRPWMLTKAEKLGVVPKIIPEYGHQG